MNPELVVVWFPVKKYETAGTIAEPPSRIIERLLDIAIFEIGKFGVAVIASALGIRWRRIHDAGLAGRELQIHPGQVATELVIRSIK